jgi:uncharacterized protein
MIFGIDRPVFQAFWSVFIRHPRINRVMLYGSRATPDFRPNDEINLALMGYELTHSDLLTIENQLDDLLLPYSIHLLIYHHLRDPDWLEYIHTQGKIFYFNLKELEEMKTALEAE